MKVLISERLSEHKYKTPEGYLICTDAILARTGKQRYTKDELFGDGDSEEVDVDRPYEQVMNEKTISSFENKPVTFDHPDEDVNVGNYKEYAVGYVRDVRQGKVDGQDVILGNLVITDQDAIDAIENGEHTDLSCGYDCDIKDDGHGSYYQNNIRGNHVALCKEGRAGNARIVDSKTHAFSRLRDSYVIEELPEDETADIYIPILKKYNLKIQKLNGNKVKVIGNRKDIVRYYDKEIGIDEEDIGIKDNKMNDDSVNDAFNNGKLKDFRIEDLIRLVKERKEAVNSIRLDDKGNIYYIVVDGSLDTDLNTGKNASLDVVCEDKESHHQKRCIMLSRASSWKEIIATFNRWRNTIRDSIEDSNIVDYDIDDAWSGTRNGIIYSYHNGYYYITHENGKVERLPESKFDKIEDLYEYVDKIKDSSNLSTSKALKMIGIVSMLRKK